MNRSQVDANGIGQIEIEFETKGPGLEVTKCEAHWVYEQDIEFVILISASSPILDTMKLWHCLDQRRYVQLMIINFVVDTLFALLVFKRKEEN